MGGKAFGGRRVSCAEAAALGSALVTDLYTTALCARAEVAGSVRRGLAEVGDVDLVVASGDDHALAIGTWLATRFGRQTNGDYGKSGLVDGIQVDVLLSSEPNFGAALLHYTGSVAENIRLRRAAKKRGWLLNERGLFEIKTRHMLAGETEESVYAALGLPFKLPHER